MASIWTVAFQIANFLALVWLLQRFLYRPVTRAIAERARKTAEATAVIDEAKQAAEAGEAQLATEREQLAADRQRDLDAARAHALAERDAILDKARADATALIAAARGELERERGKAVHDLEAHAVEVAVALAARLLAAVGVADELFLPSIAEHLARLPPERRDALDAASGVDVVTAHPLDDATAAKWSLAVTRTFGGGVPLHFHSDAALIAGAELHFRTAVLRFSWRDLLGHVREEIAPHAVAL